MTQYYQYAHEQATDMDSSFTEVAPDWGYHKKKKRRKRDARTVTTPWWDTQCSTASNIPKVGGHTFTLDKAKRKVAKYLTRIGKESQMVLLPDTYPAQCDALQQLDPSARARLAEAHLIDAFGRKSNFTISARKRRDSRRINVRITHNLTGREETGMRAVASLYFDKDSNEKVVLRARRDWG